MRIPLNRHSDTPLYRQIESFLRQGILSGSLSPETRLPASRQLAQDLGVNRITVANAYAELEADGLIASRVGDGTYVLPPYPLPTVTHKGDGKSWPLWQRDLEAQNEEATKPEPDEMLRAAGHPTPISFAVGTGDSHLFPVDDLRRVMQNILRHDGTAALEYGEPNGYGPLRSTIAYILASQGLQTHADNILITSGSQQALALVSQFLLKPDDVILVESPTYSEALSLFRGLRLKVVGVPIDEDGMQVDRLEKLLQQHHPKLIYTIPNFHNPTGVCLSGQRRRQLLALADRYNVPILEDDFVGDLRYDGRAQPALKSLDPGGRVIYVSTFSKMLTPGLRAGFLVAEGPVYDSLVEFKRTYDLATSSVIQRALEAYVTVGRYQTHLRRSCQVYRKRRDAMLLAIHRHLPAGVQVIPPQGGLFIWLTLPDNLSADDLLPLACREGVAFAPGRNFFPEPSSNTSGMRLSFVTQPPERIEKGIERLGKAIRRLSVMS
ncbi:MAG: PLP-dependent aminotransferase family protein [Anaerolineae bacterium]|nr:PLP-dependent aminotransferase family protein [Anaerolineae bacterium]